MNFCDCHIVSCPRCDTLAVEVKNHRDGAEPNDDLTMMCPMAAGAFVVLITFKMNALVEDITQSLT